MKSRLLLIVSILLVTLQVRVQAATLSTLEGVEVDSSETLCSNVSYTYNTESTNMVEAEITAADTSMLVATINASNGQINFEFPSNIENLVIYIYEYSGEERNVIDTLNITTSDCGYEQVVDDYSKTTPQAGITVDGEKLVFTKPDVSSYKLFTNQLEPEDDGKSREVTFKDGSATLDLESDIVQITEEYTNDDGESVVHYFELDLSDQLIIRELNDFELDVIKPLEYIDVNLLVRVLMGIILILILNLLKIKFSKKLKAKKEYERKRKKLKKYNREKRLQEIHDKKEKMLKEQEEREYRANLEIRK